MLVAKILWLYHSQKTDGIFAFAGMGNSGEQVKLSYSVIYFKYGKETIWFDGLGNLQLKPGTRIPIRYQTNNPSDAKVDIFDGIWMDTIIYGGLPLLVLIVIFLQPDIVPWRSKIRVSPKKPFIQII